MTTSTADFETTAARAAIQEQAGREYTAAKQRAEAAYLAAYYGAEAWSEQHHLARRQGSAHGSCCPGRAYHWHCACGFLGYDQYEFEEHLEHPDEEED